MNKLFVAGCSISDYTNVDVVYGEVLANKLDYEYIHEAAGCGSNFRIWRTITNHIMSGNLTSEDLLIVQYTNLERREFWSMHQGKLNATKLNSLSLREQPLRERYKDGGDIIRFKMGSFQWQQSKEEDELFKLYENYFVNEQYDYEIFYAQHLMFQCLLKEYSIKVIFIPLNGLVRADEINCISYFKNNVLSKFSEEWHNLSLHDAEDPVHFNENGHKYLADILYDFIIKNKII